ncbi:uncharacterized protein BJ171DRAFT_568176 [Polychytrium aggregatum]|uniref:uncharacterized protein n=1 Tax=Polychytrium aggregatum TaxID=110093 RepID=UPI0022FE4ED3|nr:uncharacterized protein BJ171DRAFT_568176 [Polychytrium aggregatum]KAI9204397.1 hypothetical protein BJ171DRAFT_568176 [Polychytrium aggregatum]
MTAAASFVAVLLLFAVATMGQTSGSCPIAIASQFRVGQIPYGPYGLGAIITIPYTASGSSLVQISNVKYIPSLDTAVPFNAAFSPVSLTATPSGSISITVPQNIADLSGITIGTYNFSLSIKYVDSTSPTGYTNCLVQTNVFAIDSTTSATSTSTSTSTSMILATTTSSQIPMTSIVATMTTLASCIEVSTQAASTTAPTTTAVTTTTTAGTTSALTTTTVGLVSTTIAGTTTAGPVPTPTDCITPTPTPTPSTCPTGTISVGDSCSVGSGATCSGSQIAYCDGNGTYELFNCQAGTSCMINSAGYALCQRNDQNPCTTPSQGCSLYSMRCSSTQSYQICIPVTSSQNGYSPELSCPQGTYCTTSAGSMITCV